jgi:hypothetical protein
MPSLLDQYYDKLEGKAPALDKRSFRDWATLEHVDRVTKDQRREELDTQMAELGLKERTLNFKANRVKWADEIEERRREKVAETALKGFDYSPASVSTLVDKYSKEDPAVLPHILQKATTLSGIRNLPAADMGAMIQRSVFEQNINYQNDRSTVDWQAPEATLRQKGAELMAKYPEARKSIIEDFQMLGNIEVDPSADDRAFREKALEGLAPSFRMRYSDNVKKGVPQDKALYNAMRDQTRVQLSATYTDPDQVERINSAKTLEELERLNADFEVQKQQSQNLFRELEMEKDVLKETSSYLNSALKEVLLTETSPRFKELYIDSTTGNLKNLENPMVLLMMNPDIQKRIFKEYPHIETEFNRWQQAREFVTTRGRGRLPVAQEQRAPGEVPSSFNPILPGVKPGAAKKGASSTPSTINAKEADRVEAEYFDASAYPIGIGG